jgi:hypothetical protein
MMTAGKKLLYFFGLKILNYFVCIGPTRTALVGSNRRYFFEVCFFKNSPEDKKEFDANEELRPVHRT